MGKLTANSLYLANGQVETWLLESQLVQKWDAILLSLTALAFPRRESGTHSLLGEQRELVKNPTH